MSKLIQVEFFCSSVSARNDLRIIFIAVGCLFLWSCGLHNQDMGIRLDQSRAIDKLIQQKQANFHIPGFAIAVIKNGSVVKKITLGLANAEAGIPVTDSTSFQLASTTKSFTATAIMTLVQDGRLRLTDSVGSILKGLPQSWQKVTVRQLLSHTSGLPDITLREGKIDLVSNTWDSSLKIIYNQPFQFAPGEKWAYDQTGYVLLSLIAEKISGMSFSKFMTETLFNKLGMRHTFFDPPTGINNSLA